MSIPASRLGCNDPPIQVGDLVFVIYDSKAVKATVITTHLVAFSVSMCQEPSLAMFGYAYEGYFWVRGWDGPEVDAFQVAAALTAPA